jgi:pimeloyl-ACP methyl ester carboxylesterase
MVHGFGVDKHSYGLFDDIAEALGKESRIVRFDFGGHGKSQGKEEEASFASYGEDLDAIIDWVRAKFGGDITLLGHSQGCFIIGNREPTGISKVILISPPNLRTSYIIKRLKERLASRPGSVLNERGLSLLARSDGRIQKIGPQFWTDLKSFRPLDKISSLARKTNLYIIRPQNDDLIGTKYMRGYQQIARANYLETPGNHDFSNRVDRIILIKSLIAIISKGGEE